MLALAALLSRKRDVWARGAMATIAVSFIAMAIAFFGGSPALDVISGQARTSARALSEHHVRAVYGSVAGLAVALLAAATSVVAKKRGGSISRPLLTALLAGSSRGRRACVDRSRRRPDQPSGGSAAQS